MPIPIPLIAAGVSALGGILSNVFGASSNNKQAKLNREFQASMYDRQKQDAIDLWRLQQEYDTPQNQLNRVLKAGLNPLLLYGQGGQVATTSSSAPQVPSAPSGAQAHNSFVNPFQTAEYLLIDAQRKKLEAETQKTESETDWQELENKWNRDSYNVRLWLQYGEYDKVRATIRDLDDQVFQRGFMNAQQAATLAQARIFEIKRFNLDYEQITTSLAQRWKEIATGQIAANAALKNACANWLNALTNKREARFRIGAMAQDILYKAKEQPYKLRNMSLQNELNKFDVGIKATDLMKGVQQYKNLENMGSQEISPTFAPIFLMTGRLFGRIPGSN